MKRILLGVALAAVLAFSVGPPAAVDPSSMVQMSYEAPAVTEVLVLDPTDAAYRVRTVYHRVHETPIDVMLKVTDKSAGKKRSSDSKEKVAERRAAAPGFPLLL